MKNKLVFLDTETTGNDLEKDRLCQVAFKQNGKTEVKNFKPTLPISVKAMSVTHITNKMVEKEKAFKDSAFSKKLQKILAENIMVAHNAKFDIAMLESEGIKIGKYICTLRLARYLDDDESIPEYNLQFLRYYYGVEIEAVPHTAEGDVAVLEAVFEYIYELAKEKAPQASEEEIINRMIDISANPVAIKKFTFGKYNGEMVEAIFRKDKGYLEWLYKTKKEEGTDEDWLFTLEKYLGEEKNENKLI